MPSSARTRRRDAVNLPLALVARHGDRDGVIAADLARWRAVTGEADLGVLGMPEFRTLLAYRLRRAPASAKLLGRLVLGCYRRERTLLLNTEDIGPGLFIQHGMATVVAAKRIGANCWINQQVTVGFTVTDREVLNQPVIEDDVKLHAGAKVIGGVTVHRGAVVGAGAVVVKDVPAGMVATGVPAVARPMGRNALTRD